MAAPSSSDSVVEEFQCLMRKLVRVMAPGEKAHHLRVYNDQNVLLFHLIITPG